MNWASKRYDVFFLDELKTLSVANPSNAGDDRDLNRRGRRSVAVVQKGGGRSGKGGGGVLGACTCIGLASRGSRVVAVMLVFGCLHVHRRCHRLQVGLGKVTVG
jgi:hypothetical protein